jgi:hypothetical protein
MTLPLPGGHASDPVAQAKFDEVSLRWPQPGSSPSLPSTQNVVLLSGAVNTNATILLSGTGGWTVARTPAGVATGDYTVTFDRAFSSGNVVPTTSPADDHFVKVAAVTTSTMRVVTAATIGGAAVDAAWYFHVLGPV